MLSITLGVFMVFTIVMGCTCSDASWAIQKYIQGDRISDDRTNSMERVYRAKLAADLMMGLSIMFGVASGFFLLFVLLWQL